MKQATKVLIVHAMKARSLLEQGDQQMITALTTVNRNGVIRAEFFSFSGTTRFLVASSPRFDQMIPLNWQRKDRVEHRQQRHF